MSRYGVSFILLQEEESSLMSDQIVKLSKEVCSSGHFLHSNNIFWFKHLWNFSHYSVPANDSAASEKHRQDPSEKVQRWTCLWGHREISVCLRSLLVCCLHKVGNTALGWSRSSNRVIFVLICQQEDRNTEEQQRLLGQTAYVQTPR